LGEDRGNTCGRKDFMLTVKEVPLCGGRDKGVIEYGFSYNSRTHGKTTSP
jgi:predicted RNA methylase